MTILWCSTMSGIFGYMLGKGHGPRMWGMVLLASDAAMVPIKLCLKRS
jgi:hypothetical protein